MPLPALTSPPTSPTETIVFATAPRGPRAWGYFALLAAAPGAAAAYAAWLSIYAYTHYGPVAAWYRPRPYWLLAIVLAAVSLLLALQARWRRQTHLRMGPTGFTVRLAPRPPVSLLWRDVVGIETRFSRSIFGRMHGVIVLHLRDGSRLRLDGRFPNLPGLARRLQRHLYADQLPALRRRWAAGQPLDFGILQIDRHGLTVRQRAFPWHSIARIEMRGGRLVIELNSGKPLILSLRRLRNPDILLWWLHDEAKR